MTGRRLAAATVAAALIAAAVPPSPALAQSAGCQALIAAASQAVGNENQALTQAIRQPQSVSQLTCLDSLWNGAGLNLFASLTDFTALVNKFEGQLCSALKGAWTSMVGTGQCGLSITGFNLGFGGLGGGGFCPSLSVGGGGQTLFSAGAGTGLGNGSYGSNGGGYYLNSRITVPTGYPTGP